MACNDSTWNDKTWIQIYFPFKFDEVSWYIFLKSASSDYQNILQQTRSEILVKTNPSQKVSEGDEVEPWAEGVNHSSPISGGRPCQQHKAHGQQFYLESKYTH